MDTAQWAQGIGVTKKPMEEGSSSNNNNTRAPPPAQSQQQLVNERRSRPLKEQALNCPRCNSTNTKFCYYNNYSLTQPRYFCKTCRRYWTEGGSLRNVPVGGGSRKNKRHSSSASSASSTNTSAKVNSHHLQTPPPLPSISHITAKPFQGQDLNLAFHNSSFSELIGGVSSNMNGAGELSAMELLRNTGIVAGARGQGPLVQMSMPMPDTATMYGGGFGLHDFGAVAGVKFPFDGIGCNANNGNVMQEGGGRLMFPFGDLKPVSMKSGAGESDHQQNRGEQGGDHQQMFWSGANLGAGGAGSW